MRYFYTDNGKLLERKPKIIFAFKGRLRGTGSRYMRCDQLADFTRRSYGETYDICVDVLPHPQHKPARWKKFLKLAEGAVVISLKGSTDILSDEELGELRNTASGLAIDHVDSFSGGGVFVKADLHIAASQASENFMFKKCERIALRDGFEIPRIALVDHHADERIKATPQPAGTNLKIAYIGDSENTFVPSEIESDMLDFSVDAQTDFEMALSEIPKAHIHYAVRGETKLRQPKPFTKGFTAALANRNVICTPEVHDALRFLGENYPFMSRNSSKSSILEVVEFARQSIGSSEWNEGLVAMREMREHVRPENVSRQLISAIETFF